MAKEIQTQLDAIEKEGNWSDRGLGFARTGGRRKSTMGSTISERYQNAAEGARRNSCASGGIGDGDGNGNGNGHGHSRRFSAVGGEVEDVTQGVRECFNDAMHASVLWGATDIDLEGAAQRRASLASGIHSIYPELTEMKELLIKTKDELQNKARELEQNEQESRQKLELERRHFRNTRELLIQQHQEEIHQLSKDVGNVKKDAKVVIEFVRRKANEALDGEMEKRRTDKMRMDRELQERERNLRERFNQRLETVEKQVAHALHQEHFVVETNNDEKRHRKQDDTIASRLSSSPRPLRRLASPKNGNSRSKSNLHIRVPPSQSDASVQGEVMTNDSISTHEGQYFTFTDNREWFQERISELDKWTDTLANSLNTARDAPFDEDTNASNSPTFMPHPPPVRRISTIKKWEI